VKLKFRFLFCEQKYHLERFGAQIPINLADSHNINRGLHNLLMMDIELATTMEHTIWHMVGKAYDGGVGSGSGH
jgi:hypothetical protein